MNRRQIISCHLSILMGIIFFPQPKALAQSSLPGCQAQLYTYTVIQNQAPQLTQAQIINGSDVQQVSSQEELLAVTQVPYKSSATSEIPTYWQMRITNTDFNSLAGKNATYKVISYDNKTGNPFNKNATAKPLKSIQKIQDCADGNTVVVGGGMALEFNELSKLVSGTFTAEVQVCLPTPNNVC
jgi:hypothetical protein